MKKYAIYTCSLLIVGCSIFNKNNDDSIDDLSALGFKTLDFEGIDASTSPKDDFYQFSCGSWLKNNPIPDEDSRWSNFNVLSNSNNEILKQLLENAAEGNAKKGSAKQLIGDYYYSFSNLDLRDELGIEPIVPYFNQIDAIQNHDALLETLVFLHKQGIDAGFGVGVMQDAKNNEEYAVYLSQGGIGLPNRDYYFNKDSRSEKIRTAYKDHITNMFELSKLGSSDPELAYKMEESFANFSWSPVQLRDMESQYNKMSITELNNLAPGFKWSEYFEKMGIETNEIIVGQKEFASAFAKYFSSMELDQLKSYLKWVTLNHFAGSLTTQLNDANFGFYYTTMRGVKKQKELWKRGVMSVTSSPIGEALGQVFVEDNFTEDAKKKVDEMVDNITIVFEERINSLDWMSPETKTKAQEKLSSFARKLGFPDEWKSYEGLEINKEEFFQNTANLGTFAVQDNLKKLGTKIDKSEWQMAPQIVNAYYNPLLNEIVFPAGIMQKPFFSSEYEDAVNYARMGAVIGHELTHGFDDQGAQFNAKGEMINWWSEEDKKKFNERTQKLVDQYNAYEVLEGVFINGELTLGENIADLGGLTIAYHAFQKSLEGKKDLTIKGYNSNQRFFMAFGQVWQNNIRDNALVQRVNTDPHSPGKYRVNGVVSNMPEFFEAFDIQEGDAMRQPKEKIAKIW